MYDLFRKPAAANAGGIRFGELEYLRRSYAKQLTDIKSYYRRAPKRIDSDNVLGRILGQVPLRWDLPDQRYVHFVEDIADNLLRAFGCTSPTYKGRVHTKGITLGPQSEEIVLAHESDFDVNKAKRQWRFWNSYRFLYHTRYDMGMPILNNTLPGKGWGVAVIDLPMMALQYRYWLQQQVDDTQDQVESIFRFIGGIVLPNTLDSYLDIAFFNRLDRIRQGLPTKRFTTPHPFYLTDYSKRCDSLCEKIVATHETRDETFERTAQHTPMLVKPNLREVMVLPHDPITRQNEWALQIARLPYVNYLLREYLATHRGDRRVINEIYTSLKDAVNDRIFNGVGSRELSRFYQQKLEDLIAHLEDHQEGWT